MINKKKLIDLFEDRVPHARYEEEYVGGNYYPCIVFDSHLTDRVNEKTSDAKELGIFKAIHYDDCRMAIFQKKDIYFITFNSVEMVISFPEFKRLKKLFLKFKDEQLKYNKIVKNIQDNKLLDKVFHAKSKKETRSIVIEKITTQVKNYEHECDEDVAKAYEA